MDNAAPVFLTSTGRSLGKFQVAPDLVPDSPTTPNTGPAKVDSVSANYDKSKKDLSVPQCGKQVITFIACNTVITVDRYFSFVRF